MTFGIPIGNALGPHHFRGLDKARQVTSNILHAARPEASRAVPLRDRAYRMLRDAIVTGELEPGAVIRDAELAERVGLSRTPVREALARLADEGWSRPSRTHGPG